MTVGGLDSITLFLFLRSIGINVPAVSVSSLEDKSIQLVHKALGIRSLPPIKDENGRPYTKMRVIQQYGYPVISKEAAQKISHLQNPTSKNATVRHAIMTGETGEYGGFKKNSRMKMSQKWLEKFGGPENENEGTNYQTAPFKVSDACCYYLKERPCDLYAKETKCFPYLGLMASEGGRRQKSLMWNGCNYVGKKTKRSCPFAIFSRQDLLTLALEMDAYVSDDGSVFQNTAPSTPASISVPSSIDGGSTITVSWAASTDAEGNLEGYIVERQTNGGSWSQIYQGSATSTTNSVAFGTNTVAYRVKAYDAAGLESGWKTSSTVTVTNNRAPGAPGSLTVPAVVRGGGNLAISWTAASDSDGNLSGYELERQVDGGGWTQIYKGSALAYTDTITAGWNTVAYRVRSYDSYNATSTYVTSETRTVDNNAIPVITSSTTSGTDLGTKEDGFDLTYTVTDADSDTVTVKEYLDNVLKRTYTATLGQSNTVQCVTAANWQKVLNGAHTIKVVANDTKADSAPYTVTFTKAVYEASITLAEPMDADDAITVMVLNVLGSIPADADLEVLVTNNANDTEPVWEDATQDVKNGNNHVFTNQTAANGFAFNFKVNVGRGTSNTGGYITSIGGAFQ